MAEKLVIDVFRNKTADEFTKALSDPESKLETGSASAAAASLAAALLLRAAKLTAKEQAENDRIAYIVKNSEVLRDYMVHLIDEDVKCRAPLHKAEFDGRPQEIEAARHPAVAICAEVVNMMCQCLDFAAELTELCPRDALHYLAESAHLALAAIYSARLYIVDMSDKCADETYRFVTRRENDITLEHYKAVAETVFTKAGI